MPIPELNINGLLPVGIHDCTVDEIYQSFGRFSSNDRRPQLFGQLQEYLLDARDSGMFSAIIIDGSFVTNKTEPGDIDLVAVLTSDMDLTIPLRPFHYNVVSTKRVRKRLGLDLKAAHEGSDAYTEYIKLYTQVKGHPDLQKGLLRIML